MESGDAVFFISLNAFILCLMTTPLGYYFGSRSKYLAPKVAITFNIILGFVLALVVSWVSLISSGGLGNG